MEIPINAATIGLGIILLGNIIVIILAYSKLSSKVDDLVIQQAADRQARKELIIECNKKHDVHFQHALNTGIHQEAMSREATLIHFEGIHNQISALEEEIRTRTASIEIVRQIQFDVKTLMSKKA